MPLAFECCLFARQGRCCDAGEWTWRTDFRRLLLQFHVHMAQAPESRVEQQRHIMGSVEAIHSFPLVATGESGSHAGRCTAVRCGVSASSCSTPTFPRHCRTRRPGSWPAVYSACQRGPTSVNEALATSVGLSIPGASAAGESLTVVHSSGREGDRACTSDFALPGFGVALQPGKRKASRVGLAALCACAPYIGAVVQPAELASPHVPVHRSQAAATPCSTRQAPVAVDTGHVSCLLMPRLTSYFEVTIGNVGGRGQGEEGEEPWMPPDVAAMGSCVAVGLSTARFPLLGRMPGWDAASYGWHSDDGKRFHRTGVGMRFGPAFGAGDTVGCGVDFSSTVPASEHRVDAPHLRAGRIFYTLNGAFVGYAFTGVDVRAPLWPAVGVDSPHPLTFNFGALPGEGCHATPRPFMFDVRAFEWHLWRRLARHRRRLTGSWVPLTCHAVASAASTPPHSSPGACAQEEDHTVAGFEATRVCAAAAVRTSLKWSRRLASALRHRFRRKAASVSRSAHGRHAALLAASTHLAVDQRVSALHGTAWALADAEPVSVGDVLLSWMLRRLRAQRAPAVERPATAVAEEVSTVDAASAGPVDYDSDYGEVGPAVVSRPLAGEVADPVADVLEAILPAVVLHPSLLESTPAQRHQDAAPPSRHDQALSAMAAAHYTSWGAGALSLLMSSRGRDTPAAAAWLRSREGAGFLSPGGGAAHAKSPSGDDWETGSTWSEDSQCLQLLDGGAVAIDSDEETGHADLEPHATPVAAHAQHDSPWPRTGTVALPPQLGLGHLVAPAPGGGAAPLRRHFSRRPLPPDLHARASMSVSTSADMQSIFSQGVRPPGTLPPAV